MDEYDLQDFLTADAPACSKRRCNRKTDGAHQKCDRCRELDREAKRRQRAKTPLRGRKCKFSSEQVDEIRERYEAGGVTQQALADRFKVTPTTIGQIVRFATWQDPNLRRQLPAGAP